MPDKKEFIAMFKAEAEELVTKLDKGLVELEKDPHNLEIVKDLNMVAHSLKGAARIFGFRDIHDITHKIESLFEKVQQRSLTLSPNIADKIFKGLDRIRILLDKTIKPDSIAVDITDVCLGLESCLPVTIENEEKPVKGNEEMPKVDPTITALPVPPAAESSHHGKDLRGETSATTDAEEYIRVPLRRVNKLLNLVGEMVIAKMKTSARINRLKNLTRLTKKIQGMVFSVAEMIKTDMPQANAELIEMLGECQAGIQRIRADSMQLLDHISTETFHLDPVIEELQANIKEIRMLPLATIFEGFPRMVRDIAHEQGKEVNLEIFGAETELDKKVLDGIKAALTHILRNSVDHGIEKPEIRAALGKPRAGTIKLSAGHEAGNVVIAIEDDGKGLDTNQIKQMALKKTLVTKEELEKMTEREIWNIIFMNGYSTSPIITDISGRGIGLDIARQDIENLKGQIFLDSESGKGTALTLTLPLTIAIIKVLLLKVADKLFALPLISITECISVSQKDISKLDGKMAIHVREHALPVVKLSEVLGLHTVPQGEEDKDQPLTEEITVIIVSSLDKQVGFIVDEIVTEEEVFIKSLGAYLGKVKNVSGAAILGTGEVVVILDVEDLLVNSRLSHPAVLERSPSPIEKKKGKRILIVDDILSTRELEKNILESQGYLVDVAIDGVDGLDKINQVRYDLIVSDIQMPRMDGFEFCENLKKNELYKDIPFVIVSALGKDQDKRRGIEVGASAYIIKTAFDQTSLLDTIERLIG